MVELLMFNCNNVLIVDDNPNNLEVLSHTLNKFNIQVSVAVNGESAIEQIKYFPPALILLDIVMPEISGFETYDLLKQDDTTKNIPIIFITALSDIENKVKAFSMGAVDYITKPFQQDEVIARVKIQLRLCQLNQALNQQNDYLQSQITAKQKAENALLKLNNELTQANCKLNLEVKERKKAIIDLQQEIFQHETTERKLQIALEQKELLLKEIHHRVKNNLVVASSLLSFQSSYIDHPETLKALQNTQERIKAMALVHEYLYNSSDLENINFGQYVQNLANQILYCHNALSQNINLVLNIAPVLLSIETANPCGLIINELLSNSLKHGFKQKSKGNIYVTLEKSDSDYFILIVKDDGVGFPPELDVYNSQSLGLELIYTLVEQLEGKVEIKNNNGAETIITFTELNYKKRLETSKMNN